VRRNTTVLIAFNKPYGVVCQFSPSGEHPTLADFIAEPNVYPAGRLDHDSEGLVLLTDEGALQHAIAHPDARLKKRYWCQIEGVPGADAFERLAAGVSWGHGVRAHQASALGRAITAPAALWPRTPPIRLRRDCPTSWIELEIGEGRNRQVRHMTAAVGHPTLRLLRVAIGTLDLFALGLSPGESRAIDPAQLGSLAVAGRADPPRTTRRTRTDQTVPRQPRTPRRR
jgi:23S rRNA pseudouridine2457 synthase